MPAQQNDNTITASVLSNAQVRTIDFTLEFEGSIKKLIEALGVTRKYAKTAGTVLKTYKASGTLESGAVAEGATIPLSQYTVSPTTYKEIAIKKWRKATTAEAIAQYGYDQAIVMTSERMVKDVQSGIRSDFFSFLASAGETQYRDVGSSSVSGATLDSAGTHVTAGHYYTTYIDGTAATGVGLQAALANGWGKLQILFENDDIETVFFCNPLDVSDYLGTANISIQNAFGMSYVENFLGLGTLIMNSNVPSGTFYATAKNNVVLYYIPVNGADLGEAFAFTSDATGYVGIHENADYNTMTAVDTVVCGIEMFAERIDGVVVGSITQPQG